MRLLLSHVAEGERNAAFHLWNPSLVEENSRGHPAHRTLRSVRARATRCTRRTAKILRAVLRARCIREIYHARVP